MMPQITIQLLIADLNTVSSSKFTNSKELGKHVINHIEADYKAGILSCRQSDAERLRRALEGLGTISLFSRGVYILISCRQCEPQPRQPISV